MKQVLVLLTLTAFHLRVGARLAMRALVPFTALVVARIGTDAEPDAALSGIAHGVAGPGFDPGIAAALLASSLAIAAWASPRLTQGLTGWTRHLPASSAAHRRAAVLGLAAAQGPLLACALLLGAGLVAGGGARSLSATKLLGLPLLALGSAAAVLPVRRRLLSAAAGAGAAAAAVLSAPSGLLASAALLLIADRTAGPVEGVRRAAHHGQPARPARLPALLALRALGWRIAGALPAGLLPLAAAGFFLANNRLHPAGALLAARLGGGLACVAFVAGLAQTLAVRRPEWPWGRSLPWSARSRVLTDALLLGALAAPVAAAAALLRWESALAIVPGLPLLALRAATAMRTSASARTGVAGRALFEGSLGAALVSLVPWLSIGALALAPWALRAAAQSERRVKASRWSPAHHLAAGDSLSWSAR